MRAWAISAVVSVAVIMGMSSVAPVMLAYAEHPGSTGSCPEIDPDAQIRLGIFFIHRSAEAGDPDNNGNGFVCELLVLPAGKKIFVVDDILTT